MDPEKIYGPGKNLWTLFVPGKNLWTLFSADQISAILNVFLQSLIWHAFQKVSKNLSTFF